MPTKTIQVLKLQANQTFQDPSTGITIKQGQPPEDPVSPILVISEFEVVLSRSTYELSYRIYFDVFASPAKLQNSYNKIYQSSIFVDSTIASSLSTVPTDGNPLDLISATHSLLYNFLLSDPNFAVWELGTANITIA